MIDPSTNNSGPATLERPMPRPGARRSRIAVPAPGAAREHLGVVHLTWEYMPLARTGGLGEAVSGLAGLQAASHMPTTVVMPLHRCVRDRVDVAPLGAPFTVEVGPHTERVRLLRVVAPKLGPRVFLIEHPYFDRPSIYGDDAENHPDNPRRFALFARAALTALPALAPAARLLHAHDWHTALAPVYLRTAFAGHPYYNRLAAVLSVHNAGFQGLFPPETVEDLGLPYELYDWRVFEWYGRMNVLKGGLAFADAVVTVSPGHAAELCTPEGGFGLHDTFRALGDRLVGVLNGIDPARWNPASDPEIAAGYFRGNLRGKRQCKAALQRAFGLAPRPESPLIAMCARLVPQKGLDLLLDSEVLSKTDRQFIVLGEGEARYAVRLSERARAALDRIGVALAFTDRLEHQLLAGADLLLMPSLYEPCGLTQMRAQRYGTIPVARRVGGLADTIEDDVTGFLFDDYRAEALGQSLDRAIERFARAPAWQCMMREAMSRDFSWRRSGERYRDVYRQALRTVPVDHAPALARS